MPRIAVGIIGVGNCCSALLQGVEYYRNSDNEIPGLITRVLAGYRPSDIAITSAFDTDRRKVGLDVSEAIFAKPNCARVFQATVPTTGTTVQAGFKLDSFAAHMHAYPIDDRPDPIEDIDADEAAAKERIVRILKESKTEVLVNYLPVGSELAARFYADCAIAAGCAFVNAMPVFVSQFWGDRFRNAGLPILGDDIKSQVGATIINRMLARLVEERGQTISRVYQVNFGGNTDFLNMLDRTRLESKKISKTGSVTSQLANGIIPENIHVGPSDYIPWMKDNKVCYIRIEGEQFGGVPMNMEVRLSVEDSPNSAGVIVDAIRAAKVALDRKLAGPILEASAWLFKTPIRQVSDEEARQMLLTFCAANAQ
jgi:myo-inositol-1-phosphate synthase